MVTTEDRRLFKVIRNIVDPERTYIRVYNERRKNFRRMKFWYGNVSPAQVERVQREFVETGISDRILWHGICDFDGCGFSYKAYVVKVRYTNCQLNKELV